METFSIILTISLGVAAVFSPIFVALVNNRYNTRLRVSEQKHEQALKEMELSHQLSEKQIDTYYADKRTAFCKFMDAIGNLILGGSSHSLEEITSTANTAILFCSYDNQKLINEFLIYVNRYFTTNFSAENREKYIEMAFNISVAFNRELMETMPNQYNNETGATYSNKT